MRDADLQDFLKINAGFVEIVTPEAYLETLGWEVVVYAEAGTTIVRKVDFDIGSIDRNLLTTNKSVEDVVQNCYYHGYVTSSVSSLTSQFDWEAITMASSAQPSTSGNQFMAVATNATYGEGTATLGHPTGNTLRPQQQSAAYGIDHGLTNADTTNQRIDSFYRLPNHTDQQMTGPFESTSGTVTHATMAEIDAYVGFYPNNLAFNPYATQVFAWDPFHGDPFDAFDISGLDEEINEEDWFQWLAED